MGWDVGRLLLRHSAARRRQAWHPLDGFIGTFETFVTGLGLVVGLVGLTGYVGA